MLKVIVICYKWDKIESKGRNCTYSKQILFIDKVVHLQRYLFKLTTWPRRGEKHAVKSNLKSFVSIQMEFHCNQFRVLSISSIFTTLYSLRPISLSLSNSNSIQIGLNEYLRCNHAKINYSILFTSMRFHVFPVQSTIIL